MKREIKQCMAGLAAAEDGALTARFTFPETFIGFQGHFPGKKILPGVCQVQGVLAMLEEHHGKQVTLKEMVLVKFFSPVAPGEEVTCRCQEVKQDGGDVVVKAAMQKGDQKVSEMKLRATCEA